MMSQVNHRRVLAELGGVFTFTVSNVIGTEVMADLSA